MGGWEQNFGHMNQNDLHANTCSQGMQITCVPKFPKDISLFCFAFQNKTLHVKIKLNPPLVEERLVFSFMQRPGQYSTITQLKYTYIKIERTQKLQHALFHAVGNHDARMPPPYPLSDGIQTEASRNSPGTMPSGTSDLSLKPPVGTSPLDGASEGLLDDGTCSSQTKACSFSSLEHIIRARPFPILFSDQHLIRVP